MARKSRKSGHGRASPQQQSHAWSFDPYAFIEHTYDLSTKLLAFGELLRYAGQFKDISELWLDGGASQARKDQFTSYVANNKIDERIDEAIKQLDAWLKYDKDEVKAFTTYQWDARGVSSYASPQKQVEDTFKYITELRATLAELKSDFADVRGGRYADLEDKVSDLMPKLQKAIKSTQDASYALYYLAMARYYYDYYSKPVFGGIKSALRS